MVQECISQQAAWRVQEYAESSVQLSTSWLKFRKKKLILSLREVNIQIMSASDLIFLPLRLAFFGLPSLSYIAE